MNANRRLFWTQDRSRLVEESDARAAFLAYAPGDEVAKGDEKHVPRPPVTKAITLPPETKELKNG